MKRYPIKKVDTSVLTIDTNVNVREPEAYTRVQGLKSEIAQVGGITEALHVRKEDNVVLRGNLRLTAARELLADPNITAKLRDALEKLDVIFVEGLDARETLDYVLDHGNVTPLSRVEIVKTVWKLQKEMRKEPEIATTMFGLLSRYTGNSKKALDASNIKDQSEREKFVYTWLHGTLGNYIMAAGQMGPLVREQFILTDRAKDRPLTEEEQKLVKFDTKRSRINELNTAKGKDDKSAKGWSQQDGGEQFNKLIDKFISEDNGTAATVEKGPTKSDMTMVANSLSSDLSLAYQHCAGTIKPEQKAKIDALDTEIYRMSEIKKAAQNVIDRVDIGAQFSGGEVREVLKFFITGGDLDFAAYVQRFLTK